MPIRFPHSRAQPQPISCQVAGLERHCWCVGGALAHLVSEHDSGVLAHKGARLDGLARAHAPTPSHRLEHLRRGGGMDAG